MQQTTKQAKMSTSMNAESFGNTLEGISRKRQKAEEKLAKRK